ncbi:uncharacterized protein [Garra rufa]|uniref:uncharacterized protein n=1 Tax=Garra rufa TaxID=137080 RepID=UPI003CCE5A57
MELDIKITWLGVFAADGDEVKTVSVSEGDSVTLNSDLNQTQKVYLIEWRFGDPIIAKIDRKEISYAKPTERFRDRLLLDQSGSLTIKNMRTKHSGLYELQISHSSGTLDRKFNVTVKESPDVSDAGKDEMKIESVIEGDPVTLQTDVTQLDGDELIVWRSGEEGKLIAKADIETKGSLFYDNEERFRNRLELDHQTGSLTITNTRTTDSGLYTLKISSNYQTTYKRFTVAVSGAGLSLGAVAGIVIVVLLVAAATAAVVIYFRHRISELKQTFQSVPALEGDTVTLNPVTEIKTGDHIQWMFEDDETLIAEIKKKSRGLITYDTPDERFRDRLVLNKKTGSLTILNIRTEHTGNYTLKITRGRETLYNRFNVYISDDERNIAVMEGEPVTLKPDTEINKDDMIWWMFGDEKRLSCVVKLNGMTGDIVTCDYAADGRFRDILDLDKETGSLTINNTRTAHSGVYKLEIMSSSRASQQTFIVTVKEKVEEKLLEEDSVTLNPDTEIQRDDRILWMFGPQDSLIAQIRGGTGETYDGHNGRFRGRLTLNEKTGALTITNITPEHTGLYKLQTISSRGILCKKFRVFIQIEYKAVTAGESLSLYAGKQRDDDTVEVQWRFGDENSVIAEIKGGTGETYDGPEGRFRDRLELDKKTGHLTINNSRAEDAGLYKLKIRSSEGNTHMIYIVAIRDAGVTDEARKKSMKEDHNGERVNESATVEMIPLVDK